MEDQFRRPGLQDQELISGYFTRYPSRSCDRTFANIYLWAPHYQVEFMEYKKTLLFRNSSREHSYAFPAGEDQDVKAVIEEWIQMKEQGIPVQMYCITSEQLERLESWFPGRFQCEFIRDDADYVYEAEKLASLSGKKLQAKRNHMNKFLRLYENRWQYEKLTQDNLKECIQMAAQWRVKNGCDQDPEKNHELCVALNALRQMERLRLTGGALRVDGEIVAFTLGEPVGEDTFVVHIEKAYTEVESAYTMINQQFVQNELLGKFQYVNREEDVGVEGLRKAKTSYRPVFMIEKGHVTII